MSESEYAYETKESVKRAKSKMSQSPESVTGTQTTPEEASAELTLQDLLAVKSIIDISSQRGAFKPNEMVAVGTIYNKLEKFLMLAQKNQGQ
jgi:hypothetical protein